MEQDYSADNNKLCVQGFLISDLTYDHTVFDEDFYMSEIDIPRSSGYDDIIPIIVSGRLIDVNTYKNGVWVKIEGQFRSYNLKEDENSRPVCKLNIFVQDIRLLEESERFAANEVTLDGYICKDPRYRTTPLGREITDLLVAVNRAYKKSDYIPCICWGRNAKYTQTFGVSTHIQLSGRVQSRNYRKRIDDDKYEERTCYEVSVNTISQIEDTIDDIDEKK